MNLSQKEVLDDSIAASPAAGRVAANRRTYVSINALDVFFMMLWFAAMCLNAAPGDVDVRFNPGAINSVLSMVIQADCKILVGGQFSSLAGQSRQRIARLNADGTLDVNFNPGANDRVNCLAVQADGKILVGGYFTNLAGQFCGRIARLNADGSLDSGFKPTVNDSVNSLLVQVDGRILVGGAFTNLTGQTCNRIACLTEDGSADPGFNPDANDQVYSMGVQTDGKILVGGDFTILGGQMRNRIARLNANGNLDLGFNPSVSSTVYALAIQADGKILVGGAFTNVAGQTRNRIARLNADGSLDFAFNPDANNGGMYNTVNSLAVQTDGKILVGGVFTTMGGNTRNYIARLNVDGSVDSEFNPNANNSVYSLMGQADGKILVAGGFATLGGMARDNLARVENDAVTQSLVVLNGNYVRWRRGGALPESQSVIFDFSIDGGITWAPLGAGKRIVGGWELTGLNLPANGKIRGRAWISGGLYSGSIGLVQMATAFPAAELVLEQPVGTPVANGGIINFGTAPLSSSTNLTFSIYNLGGVDLTGLNISIGGSDATQFTIISIPPSYISGPTGSSTFTLRFTPTSSGQKTAMLHIASNDPDDNPFEITLNGWVPVAGDLDMRFNPGANNMVTSLALQKDGKILVGGWLNMLGGLTRNYIARLNTDGKLDLSFNPNAGERVQSMAVQMDGKILVGGTFTTMGTQACNRIVRLNVDGSLDSSFNLSANSAVNSLVLQPDGKILVGGTFTSLGGQPRNCIGRVYEDGSLDVSFNPSANSDVNSLQLQADGKILVGGFFTNLNGQVRNRIARLNADGSLDSSFNPAASASVYSIAMQLDGRIIVGGWFTNLNGQARNRIARLHTDGSLDTSFNPNANDAVYSLAVQGDGKILLAGNFTTLSGQTRNRVARLDADGNLENSFNPNANNSVFSMVMQPNGKILLGGWFTTLGGQPRNRIARLENDSVTEVLTVMSASQVQWLRSGALPEIQSARFDLTTDSGITWIPLGAGTRIASGWELTGLSLPICGQVRASARIPGGQHNASSSLFEILTEILCAPVLAGPFIATNHFRFLLPTVSGRTYQVQFTPILNNSLLWQSIRTVHGDGTVIEISSTPTNFAGFYRIVVQP